MLALMQPMDETAEKNGPPLDYTFRDLRTVTGET